MSVWFDVNINSTLIGQVEIVRIEDLDLTDQAGIQDVVNTYDVFVNGLYFGPVRHRYGDGAWRLIAIAANLIEAERPTWKSSVQTG